MNSGTRSQLPGVVLCAALSVAAAIASQVTRPIKVAHPGYAETGPVDCALIQTRDAQGAPEAYHMDVDSVVCGDDQCSIVKVRLHWDALGKFARYELPAGGELTKKDHKVFSRADHEKMQRILSDRESLLKHVEKAQVVAPDQAMLDVDAVTGATPLSLQSAVVSGAVYTCYTLWHWANGDAAGKIRQTTGDTSSDDHLLQYVRGGPEDLAIFAMDEFADRGLRNGTVVDTVIDRVGAGSLDLAKAALRYLGSTATETNGAIYYGAVERLFSAGNTRQRTLYLSDLMNARQPPPAGYLDRFSRWLPRLQTYYEVHLLFELLEARNPGSAETRKHALAVLENKNFLIARRAFWFLEEQPLSDSQRQKVEAFRAKYEDRL